MVTDGRRRTRKSRRNIDLLTDNNGDEFPILKSLGLYASEIRGDGNCQFRALSDQIRGDGGSRHAEVRKNVVNYMQEHADYFKQFLGGLGYGEDGNIQGYIARMSEDGVYGDNGTIVAFARQYKKDVVIFQSDFMYIVRWQESKKGSESLQEDVRNRVYIAYHAWEHYSSVRNINGPHEGVPNVEPNEEAKNNPSSVVSSCSASWKLSVVRKSLCYPINDERIVEKLEQHDGDIASTVEDLIMHEFENGEPVTKEKSPTYSDDKDDRSSDSTKDDRQTPPERPSTKLNASRNKSAARPRRLNAREKKEKQKKDALERKRAKLGQKQASTDNNNHESVAFRTMYV